MRSPINIDVALQYASTRFPLAEALVRGREDFLADLVVGRKSSCPYRTIDLRSAWRQGYSLEATDFAEALTLASERPRRL